MPTMVFPRTMTKGPFRGRRFETNAEYYAALAERKGTTRQKLNGEWRFHLRMSAGTLDIEVSGDPRKPEDVDKLLDLLGKFGHAA